MTSEEIAALRATPSTEREDLEYFPTPSWAVRALFPVIDSLFHAGPPKKVLDPGCGCGNIMLAMADHYRETEFIGVEIDRGRSLAAKLTTNGRCNARIMYGNFLEKLYYEIQEEEVDLVVANPPFSYLYEFVERALEVTPKGTPIITMSRLNWIAGARAKHPKRSALLKKLKPEVLVLEKRPPFSRNKEGRLTHDSCEYAWLLWQGQRPGTWQILECER